MGVVLGAVDLSLGRKVAIKFLSPQKAGRQGATERFAREARAAASLQSENVVRVFEVGTLLTGPSFIVMEHLEGADLAQTLDAQGPLPVEEAVDYVLQACEAIGEAHRRGIVHRDLKPQNLFLTRLPNGRACVKVLDFGISKAIEAQGPVITFVDMVMGTPLYMSPEQMRSLTSVDWRSDIYALGAILFELITASPIYDADTTAELAAMIALMPPVALRSRRPEAAAELEAAIARCVHKDPNGRFQDVAELAAALVPFASDQGRVSATNVWRVVRAVRTDDVASVPSLPIAHAAPTAAAFDTTSERRDVTRVMTIAPYAFAPSSGVLRSAAGNSSFPPMAAHVHHPAPPVPTTQQTWGPPGSTRPSVMPRHRAPSSAAAVVSVSLFVGLLGLGLLGRGGHAVFARKTAAVSATSRAPAAVSTKDETLEAEQRIAQGRCSHMQFLLRTNDLRTNDEAKQIKDATCVGASGPNGTTCDRATCRAACTLLNDKACLEELEAGERKFPARF